MPHTLAAVFDDEADARKAGDALLACGFSRHDVRLSGPSRDEGAPTHGRHVVTLTADSLPEVERAAGVVERFGPIALRGDDSHFREHFTSTYAGSGAAYDDYAPAYSYGAQMAGSGRHAGRHWDEIEPELRSGWDSRDGSGDASTWEKMKAAVRHGWDRIISGDSGLTY